MRERESERETDRVRDRERVRDRKRERVRERHRERKRVKQKCYNLCVYWKKKKLFYINVNCHENQRLTMSCSKQADRKKIKIITISMKKKKKQQQPSLLCHHVHVVRITLSPSSLSSAKKTVESIFPFFSRTVSSPSLSKLTPLF